MQTQNNIKIKREEISGEELENILNESDPLVAIQLRKIFGNVITLEQASLLLDTRMKQWGLNEHHNTILRILIAMNQLSASSLKGVETLSNYWVFHKITDIVDLDCIGSKLSELSKNFNYEQMKELMVLVYLLYYHKPIKVGARFNGNQHTVDAIRFIGELMKEKFNISNDEIIELINRI